ncbi:MAG: 4a-hydroxytetrahydrobiopterin dehydratase [Thiomicrorhabdus sp.]|nr:4a-hydroxytetrahydrobiopterin dehydratase [Thiomicrorhabdus sp.]
MNERWKAKLKPASLETRFEFKDFSILRLFLDELAQQADLLDHHPNISFGRGHVSVMIYSKSDELQTIDFTLAKGIDEGYNRVTNQSEGAWA